MRALFAIAHCFDPDGAGSHRSVRGDPEARAGALSEAIASLRRTFGTARYRVDLESREVLPGEEAGGDEIEIVVCTTRGLHLLDLLPTPADAYVHHATAVEPRLLGYECQAVLAEAAGDYDRYCFLEDDIGVADPLFFAKLEWFGAQAGPRALLQPNRVELDAERGGRRVYIDGRLARSRTEAFQDTGDAPALQLSLLGRKYRFARPPNPHSGCYFLDPAQLERWMGHPSFLSRGSGFIGPLESAATLGIMSAFDVYKPAPGSMGFLEVEHLDPVVVGRHL